MNNYQIITDTACDIHPAILKEWDVKCAELTFHFVGDDREYTNSEMPISEFYQYMRDGRVAKTAAVGMEAYQKCFETVLQEGLDILYIGFATALSNSCQTAKLIAKDLMEQYPERKIICIDSRCASAGQGMLVRLAGERRDAGADLEDVAEYTRRTLPSLCHWFTVDNLVYLKRGGRVSAASALAGTLLQIKPVLHVDDEGRLIPVKKIRGRKQSIAAMMERFMQSALDPKGFYYISHGDCIDDAKLLEDMIFQRTGRRADLITDVGPVIGAHSGPGTLALFFLGSER